MNKISVVFALLMMLGFTGASSAAAILNWTSLPTAPSGQTVSNTADFDTDISASYGFGKGAASGTFSHDYSFASNPASSVITYAIELLNENILINSITLDSVALNWDSLNKRWFGISASAASHTIHLDGSFSKKSQQYQLNVSSVPVPAAIWLFGSALAGLVGVSRRKAAGLTA